jgi:hypothetical protein
MQNLEMGKVEASKIIYQDNSLVERVIDLDDMLS